MRLFLVISLAIALQGCSSTAPVAEPVVVTSESTTTTTAVDPTTTTTLDPEAADRAEIEDVLTRFYGYAYEVGAIEGAPGIDELTTEPIQSRMVEKITALAATGHTIGEGAYDSTVLDIELGHAEAAVVVCVLDEASVLDADGNEVSPFTPDPFVVDVDLLRTADGWRVTTSELRVGAAACEL